MNTKENTECTNLSVSLVYVSSSLAYALVKNGLWGKAKFVSWMLGVKVPAAQFSVYLLSKRIADLKERLTAFA